jgi:hypothetical protein
MVTTDTAGTVTVVPTTSTAALSSKVISSPTESPTNALPVESLLGSVVPVAMITTKRGRYMTGATITALPSTSNINGHCCYN